MAGDQLILEWHELGEVRRKFICGRTTIGRSASCDVSVTDPYISRVHCVIEPNGHGVFVDANSALNPITVGTQELSRAHITPGSGFVAGNTEFRIISVAGSDEPTLRIERGPQHSAHERAMFVLRTSTRELLDREGTIICQFSASEFMAFACLARKYPDAASHHELGRAVWGDMGFDQYQLHRLLQRMRQRIGQRDIFENVRSTGYRLAVRVQVG